jgi:hypothetical protein
VNLPMPITFSPTEPSAAAEPSLDVRIDGPDDLLTHADLRRLFPGSLLTGPRLDRLRSGPRVIVSLGGEVVAVATCRRTDGEMRVPDVAIDVPAGVPGRWSQRDVLNALLDGIELSTVAAGCRRIVVNPPATSLAFVERRGYRRVNERCAGGWIEKTIG